jgi:hypothetical protein
MVVVVGITLSNLQKHEKKKLWFMLHDDHDNMNDVERIKKTMFSFDVIFFNIS